VVSGRGESAGGWAAWAASGGRSAGAQEGGSLGLIRPSQEGERDFPFSFLFSFP
jgi:hypothetical protein